MFLTGETVLPEKGFAPDSRNATERGADNRAAMARLYRATDELQRWRDNATSRADTLYEAYQRRNAAIEAATGVTLPNPLSQGRVDDMGGLGDIGADPALVEGVFGAQFNDPEKQWLERAQQLESQHPDKAAAIRAAVPVGEDAIAMVKAAEGEQLAAESAMAGMPWQMRFWPQLAGGLRGSLRDPVQVATLPLGLGSAAKTVMGRIVQTIFTEAAINGGIEAGVQIAAEDWRRQTGSQIGAEGIWQQIGLAAAFGGGLGGLMQAGGEVLRQAGRMTPKAADALQRAAKGEAVAGDVEILAEAAGVEADPADLAALLRAHDDDAAAAAAYAGVDPREAGAAVDALENGRPLPQDRPAMAPENFRFFDPNTLTVDAGRFQFKEGGDGAGVTAALKGISEWKPERAGVSVVWEDEGGKLFVADGHQRTGLAKRLMAEGAAEIKLPGYVFRAADGFTAGDARVIAALKNIGEGSGSAIDAAKVLRSGKMSAAGAGLPPNSALVRDAAGLARLSDDAFTMAVNGLVDPRLAAVAGRLGNDPRLHAQMLAALKSANARSIGEAESIIGDLLEEPLFTHSQASLFGEAELTRMLVKEKAQVRMAALRALKADKITFKTLIDEEARIASAGNVLDAAANAERLQGDEILIEAVDRLSRQKGPIAEALNAAARAVAGGERAGPAARGFVDAVRSEIGRAGGNIGRIGSDGPGRLTAEPATPQAVEQAAATLEAARADEPGLFGATEKTPAGEQALLGGVDPVTDRQRLDRLAEKPMRGGDAPAGGLFGPEKDQLDILDVMVTARGADGKPLTTTHAALIDEADHAGMLADLVKSCK